MADKGIKGLMNRWGFGSKSQKDKNEGSEAASNKYSEWNTYAGCLTSDTRWSTHIATDKPIYRPGDTVHIRAVLLHPITQAPVSNADYGRSGNMEVLSPKGSVEATLYGGSPLDGVTYVTWTVPEGQAGGEYTLRIKYNEWGDMRCSPSAERKIQIRNFRTPKLNVRVEFLGRGYGPGDEVRAKVSVTRAEGGHPPASTPVSLSARVDGTPVHSAEAALDASGVCYASFKLPPAMEQGQGALSAVVRDGGNVESGGKTIPIVLRNLDIKFFPEGGVLVPGLENRVYFEARDPNEEPLEVEGEVWQVGGNAPLAAFAAVHEGRGRVSFTPLAGHAYEARITKPSSVTKPVALPALELGETSHGLPRVVLRADPPAGVDMTAAAGASVDVTVASASKATLRVALYKREVALDSKDVTIPETGGSLRLSLQAPATEYSGVLRVTVFAQANGDWAPVAERLVFRAPEKKLRLSVSGGSAKKGGGDCVPGEKAQVEVVVTDAETGEPVEGAVVGLSVVDNSNLEQVEPRRRAPRLPAMALLENEVDHLEDHSAYIDGSDLPGGSDAALAVDLLLGTQGWRRFLYQDPIQKLINGTDGEEEQKGGREKRRRAVGVQPSQERALFCLPGRKKERGLFRRAEAAPRAELAMLPCPVGAAPARAFKGAAPPSGAPLSDFGLPGAEVILPQAPAKDPWAEDAAGFGGAEAEPEPTPMAADNDAVDGAERAAELVMPDAPTDDSEDEDVQKERSRVPAPKPVAAGLAPFAPPIFFGGMPSPCGPSAAVRVYAHSRNDGTQRSTQRSDFTETVYFAASIVTDAKGRAHAQFDLSDSITSFAVVADAHKEITIETKGETDTTPVPSKTKSGGSTATATEKSAPQIVRTSAFGASDGVFKIRSVKPFHVDAKCPLELTTDDRVLLPVTLVNAVPEQASVALQVAVKGPLVLQPSNKPGEPQPMDVDAPDKAQPNFTLLKTNLEASSSAREIVPIVAGGAALTAAYKEELGESNSLPRASVTLNASASLGGGSKAGGIVHKDNVRREFAVTPKGFPQEQSVGGMLSRGGGSVGGKFALPKDTQPGSVMTSVTVFPSPVGSLSQALEALIREPYGCFEQTSATVYPNIMAQLYFKTHSGVSPELMAKSYALLGKGLEKLQSFEVKKSGGYEWFGSEPAHEALTAYGLLEFTDMAQVYPVPADMIRRTRTWLIGRKDEPKRAFHLDPQSLDQFGGAPADISNAYIVWSLTFAKMREGLEHQIASLVEQTATQTDPYFVALVAGTLYNVGRTKEAAALARGIEKHQKKDGCVYDAKTSITSSGGDSLLIETTAIAALCWLNEKQVFGANIRRAIDWLATRCKDGKFGSTQATVLALKAIIAYDIAMTSARAPGSVHLLVDGERVQSVAFDEKTQGVIAFGDIAPRFIADGRVRKVEVEMEGGADMPCAIQVRYHSERPSSASDCPVRFAVALQQPTAREGDLVEILVTVENKKTDAALPMTVAIVGLPGGLEPRHDQLKELVTRGDVAFYELRGRDIIFYWRTLSAGQKMTLRLEAVAAVPGDYVGPASRAYLYYTDELKTWAEPLKSQITPK